MTYTPIVARLDTVTAIPGADRIVAATASGYRLVVGADRKVGDLGVAFPADGVLDLRFAQAAGLLVKDPDTGAKLGGYLENPPIVRCLTLRGVRTDALWIPFDVFARAVRTHFSGMNVPDVVFDHMLSKYGNGDEVTPISVDWQGESRTLVVARKYVPAAPVRTPRVKLTPAQRVIRAVRVGVAAPSLVDAAMPRHYDTPTVHRGLARVPVGWVVYATAKLHGTSARTACVALPLSRLKRAANAVARVFGRRPFPDREVVAGTRECQVPADGTGYRAAIRDWLATRLRPGECVYYEIVGFDDRGKPLQAQRPDPKKGSDTAALAAKFGQRFEGRIVYSYGCEPDGIPITPGQPNPSDARVRLDAAAEGRSGAPQQRVFAYRITYSGVDLSHDEMRRRALEIGLEVPPLLDTWHHVHAETAAEDFAVSDDGPGEGPEPAEVVTARWDVFRRRSAADQTIDRARVLVGDAGVPELAPDFLDPRHPLEGVVLRLQPHAGAAEHRAFKYISHAFGVLQGRSKDRAAAGDASVVDAEEAEQDGPDL